jgi:glycine/D-amino acid oxidase-like deaminating enzyme
LRAALFSSVAVSFYQYGLAVMTTTVIFGAGIIGVSTAYYLSEHQPGSSIHLVEPSPELFSSASGFAGGFLARDWFAPATAELGALSFDEHRRLAEAHGGAEKWGYTSSTSISYSPASLSGKRAKGRGDDWLRAGTSRADAAAAAFEASESSAPSWLRRDAGDQVELISSEGTTAQLFVHSISDEKELEIN